MTHTPPSIAKDTESTADPISSADANVNTDTGFLGNLTLVPASFGTGSYGWKGSKRITVELQADEGDEKEKVQVQLTCAIHSLIICYWLDFPLDLMLSSWGARAQRRRKMTRRLMAETTSRRRKKTRRLRLMPRLTRNKLNNDQYYLYYREHAQCDPAHVLRSSIFS